MELLRPGMGLMIWTLIAFLVTLWILSKFVWKPLMKGLSAREQTITDSVQAAEKVKQEMAQLKNENEILLGKARDERAVMMKEAKETRDKIIAEAKEQARQETNKIVSDAQAVIEQQKMAAITELKNNVGKLVIEVSEKVLRRELSDQQSQEQYIEQLTHNVELN